MEYDTPMVGYQTAIQRMSVLIGQQMDVFKASTILAVIFGKTKEETLNDIVKSRGAF